MSPIPSGFPAALDNFSNPTAADPKNSATVPHANQHANANDAIEALEAKVGVDASTVTTSLDYLVKKGSAWTDYTPTLTQSGAVTKTVTYARWQRIGRKITVEFLLAVTGTGTAANAVSVSLPITAAQAGNMAAGSGYIFDTSAGVTFCGIAMLATTTTVVLQPTSIDAAGALGVSAFAAALAAGDSVTGSITYEAAA